MKFFLLVFAFTLRSLILHAQPNCTTVNVYITPFGNEAFISPDATPDYLRVHAETKIIISNDTIIDSLNTAISKLKQIKLYEMKREEYNKCKIIIDFVKGNYIFSSIAINDRFEFIIEDGLFNRDVVVYKGNPDFMCLLKSYFPKFIENLHNMIQCK